MKKIWLSKWIRQGAITESAKEKKSKKEDEGVVGGRGGSMAKLETVRVDNKKRIIK